MPATPITPGYRYLEVTISPGMLFSEFSASFNDFRGNRVSLFTQGENLRVHPAVFKNNHPLGLLKVKDLSKPTEVSDLRCLICLPDPIEGGGGGGGETLVVPRRTLRFSAQGFQILHKWVRDSDGVASYS